MLAQFSQVPVRHARTAIALILLTFMVAGDASQFEAFVPENPRFAIRIVDEALDGRITTGPGNEDRFPKARIGPPNPGALWLKRDGGVEGDLAEARTAPGSDGTHVVLLTLTPKGREQFAELTRTNLGHWLAMIVDAKVVIAWLNRIEMTDGKAQISGYYTEAEAGALAAAMSETINAR